MTSASDAFDPASVGTSGAGATTRSLDVFRGTRLSPGAQDPGTKWASPSVASRPWHSSSCFSDLSLSSFCGFPSKPLVGTLPP